MPTGSCVPSGVFIDKELSSSRVLEESLHRQKALRRPSSTFESDWNPPAADHGSPQGRVIKHTAQMREGSADSKHSATHHVVFTGNSRLLKSPLTQQTGCATQRLLFFNAGLPFLSIPYSTLFFQSCYQYLLWSSDRAFLSPDIFQTTLWE